MSNPQHERDTCYFCGDSETEILEDHHIVPRRHGGSDQGKNLVKLCPTCHRKIENLYDKRFFNKIGVKTETATGPKFVEELFNVEYSGLGVNDGPWEVRGKTQRDILAHYGIDADLHYCDCCWRVTFFVEQEEWPRCIRCNARKKDLDAAYTADQLQEVLR